MKQYLLITVISIFGVCTKPQILQAECKNFITNKQKQVPAGWFECSCTALDEMAFHSGTALSNMKCNDCVNQLILDDTEVGKSFLAKKCVVVEKKENRFQGRKLN
jgi:hypothetical protein